MLIWNVSSRFIDDPHMPASDIGVEVQSKFVQASWVTYAFSLLIAAPTYSAEIHTHSSEDSDDDCD
jgi:hypothetical protein